MPPQQHQMNLRMGGHMPPYPEPMSSSFPSHLNASGRDRENTRFQAAPPGTTQVRTVSNGVPPKPPRQILSEHGGSENVRSLASASASKPNTSNSRAAGSNSGPKTSVSPIYRRMPKPQSKSHLIQELLECPICFNLFDNPHVLPCQHTYCKACINTLFDKTAKTLDCPICRVKHNLPKGVDSLTANFTIKRLIELESMEAAQEAAAVESRQKSAKDEAVASRPDSRGSTKAKCIACQRFTRLRVCNDCSYMLCYDCVENPDHEYIIGQLIIEYGYLIRFFDF
jgi:hypothetical protein